MKTHIASTLIAVLFVTTGITQARYSGSPSSLAPLNDQKSLEDYASDGSASWNAGTENQDPDTLAAKKKKKKTKKKKPKAHAS